MRYFFIVLFLTLLSANSIAKTIYVSTNGNDGNIGSIKYPLKSISEALSKLHEGVDTIYILKGNYYIDKPIKVSGVKRKSKNKILISSLNDQSTLIFSTKIKGLKLLFLNCSGIKINNLKFVGANLKNRDTYDILVSIRNSSFFEVYNCYFKDAFEEGLKVSQCNDIICKNNIFENFEHEGVDFLNVTNGIICCNKIYEVGRVGVMVKGGSDNVLIFNNLIENSSKRMVDSGITIGGMTSVSSAKSSRKGAFEAYNVYAVNNTIICAKGGQIKRGLAFYGAHCSYAFSNAISNTEVGIELKKNKSKEYGWEEDVNNEDIIIGGNIIRSIQTKNISVNNMPKKFVENSNTKLKENVLNKYVTIFGIKRKISRILSDCN